MKCARIKRQLHKNLTDKLSEPISKLNFKLTSWSKTSESVILLLLLIQKGS